MRIRPIVGAMLGLHFAASVATAHSSAQDEGWRLRLTPYLWAPSLDGSLKIDGTGGDAEEEGGSALDYLSGAAMLSVEANHGDWSLLGDFIWAEFELDGTLDGPLATPFAVENDELIIGLGAARTLSRGDSARLDGVFGLRYFHADLKLDPQGGMNRSAQADLLDPYLGLRAHFGDERGLFGVAYGDIGGFGVASDLTWQGLAGAGWAWSWGDVRLGWRQIGYDFDDGGIVYDLTASGPFLAVSFQL